MGALIQKLHPALQPGRQLTVANSGMPLFSRQGDWDSGGTLHSVAMALALLGRLSDPVQVRRHADGSSAQFWDRAWPHYLHGLTLSELASFVWELNAGVRPVLFGGPPAEVLRVCDGELAKGWPVVVGWHSRHPVRAHAALAVGIEKRQRGRSLARHALLLLDPADAEPGLATFNARLEFGQTGRRPTYVTASAAYPVTVEGAVSIRLLNRPP